MRQSARLSGGPKILLLTHTWGFPDGYAATVRARLIGRALVESGAQVRVLCTRVSERPPDVVNTESSGSYKGIEFVYTTGVTTQSSSFSSDGWSTGEDSFPLFAASRACEELENWTRCISGPPGANGIRSAKCTCRTSALLRCLPS